MKFWQRPLRRFGTATAAALVCLVGLGSLGWAQDAAGGEAAFRRVSNRILCQCGCNYMVLSCNHLDCPSATYIRRTIQTSLAAGKNDDAIVAGFVEQYGAKILPEPPRKGFSWMAWIMPFAVLLFGGGAVSFVLWRWKKGPSAEELGENPAPQEAKTIPPEVSPALVEKYRARIDQELENE